MIFAIWLVLTALTIALIATVANLQKRCDQLQDQHDVLAQYIVDTELGNEAILFAPGDKN